MNECYSFVSEVKALNFGVSLGFLYIFSVVMIIIRLISKILERIGIRNGDFIKKMRIKMVNKI